MLDQQKETFREEVDELLIALEKTLLELENSPGEKELVEEAFRAMHTIKGSGAMFGFDDICVLTHEIETVFDAVRNGELPVTSELVSLSLAARDHIKTMLDAPESVPDEKKQEFVAAFRDWLPLKEVRQSPHQTSGSSSPPEKILTYRIRFRPAPDLFRRGTNPLTLLNELRDLGRCRIAAQTDCFPTLAELDPESCYTSWDIILATHRGIDVIRDAFIFVEDECALEIDLIDSEGEAAPPRGIDEAIIDCSMKRDEEIDSALAGHQFVREMRQEKKGVGEASSIRVPSDKLDAMVDLVGELVTIQSRLSQIATGRDDTELTLVAEEVERLSAELRDQTLKIRMLPIGTSFSRFKRLVRDLSQELGKEIEMQTSGAETELDKTVIERLGDPLIHIIRNSVDHGIEIPEQRQAQGKQRHGVIHLSAEHSGDSVIIEISDDGRGLDPEAIKRKAIAKGIMSEQEDLPENELFQLIFVPGFSTAQKITSVSGRGVGMDVVKRAIESLRGSIEIASRKGQGTTLRIRLPLTLAIIESLMVRIGDCHYLIPLSHVEECIELERDAKNDHGRRLIKVRERLVPYIALRQRFGIAGEVPTIQQVVITRCNNLQVGLVVDHVIGEHQSVIKNLGRMYRHVRELSGATVLGDGSLGLIIDVGQIISAVESDEKIAV